MNALATVNLPLLDRQYVFFPKDLPPGLEEQEIRIYIRVRYQRICVASGQPAVLIWHF